MKHLKILSITIIIALCSANVAIAGYIFDIDNSTFYLGGYPLEMLRYRFNKDSDMPLKNSIYAINIENDTSELIITTKSPIKAYEVSNNGFIAVATLDLDMKNNIHKQKLFIYQPNGERIKTIDDVIVLGVGYKRYFSWSKDGTKLLYITGKIITEGRKLFMPDGVWLYDFENNSTTKISDNGTEIGVKWSNYDLSLIHI